MSESQAGEVVLDDVDVGHASDIIMIIYMYHLHLSFVASTSLVSCSQHFTP